ncbi:MAG: FRG domain-containing protein [Firmicutes bacterium]|nr:FRG domain-containing protein [Bacillota bacterium]
MPERLNDVEIAEDAAIIKIEGGELGSFFLIGGIDEKRRYYLKWLEDLFKDTDNVSVGKHYFLYKHEVSPDFVILYHSCTDNKDILINIKNEQRELSTVLREEWGVAYFKRYNNYRLQTSDTRNYKIILSFSDLYNGIVSCLKKRKTIKLVEDVTSYERLMGDYQFYRGNTSYGYDLTPSLFRNKEFKDNEQDMFLEYLETCPKNEQCKSDFDTLAKMQHYGLPTRLLDVSKDKYVALFMACSTVFGSHKGLNDIGKIYAFKQPIIVKPTDKRVLELMKQIRYGNREEQSDSGEKEQVYFVSPSKPDNNDRMSRQKGSFMLFESGQYPKEKCDSVYVINKRGILKELNEKGYNEKELIPELEHLCHYIRQKYEE